MSAVIILQQIIVMEAITSSGAVKLRVRTMQAMNRASMQQVQPYKRFPRLHNFGLKARYRAEYTQFCIFIINAGGCFSLYLN